MYENAPNCSYRVGFYAYIPFRTVPNHAPMDRGNQDGHVWTYCSDHVCWKATDLEDSLFD